MSFPARTRYFVLFIFFVVGLLFVLDWATFGNRTEAPPESVSYVLSAMQEGRGAADIEPATGRDSLYDGFLKQDADVQESLPAVLEFPDDSLISEAPAPEESAPVSVPDGTQQAEQLYYESPVDGTRPKIAIIIDDIGMDIDRSWEAVDLQGPVTLAVLPYAPRAREFAAKALEKGHEILIHTPMEALNPDVDLGPMALRQNDSAQEFSDAFDKILNSFDGYVGINNHMGSKLTQDEAAMRAVMAELKKRGLLFVDSRTIHTSVGAQTARVFGIPYAKRDVFLDHEDTQAFVVKALGEVERIARERGVAVAIGHPKAVTLEALHAWIPTLADKGFDLVPIRDAVERPVLPQSLGAILPQIEPLPPPG